jgi:hypothetical protein
MRKLAMDLPDAGSRACFLILDRDDGFPPAASWPCANYFPLKK